MVQEVRDSLSLMTNGAGSESLKQAAHWPASRVSSQKGASRISKAQYSLQNVREGVINESTRGIGSLIKCRLQ